MLPDVPAHLRHEQSFHRRYPVPDILLLQRSNCRISDSQTGLHNQPDCNPQLPECHIFLSDSFSGLPSEPDSLSERNTLHIRSFLPACPLLTAEPDPCSLTEQQISDVPHKPHPSSPDCQQLPLHDPDSGMDFQTVQALSLIHI